MDPGVLCSEDGSCPAVCCCICRVPLPLLCEEHIAKHPVDSEESTHFHLPLSAREVITTIEVKRKFSMKILKLHTAHILLKQNLDEISQFEEILEKAKKEVVLLFEKEVNSRVEATSKQLYSLKAAFSTESQQAIKATSEHALEQWNPDPDTLTGRVWNFNPEINPVLSLFEGWVRMEKPLSECLQYSFEIKLPTLASYGQRLDTAKMDLKDEQERLRSELGRNTQEIKELKTEKAAALSEIEGLREANAQLRATVSQTSSEMEAKLRCFTEEKEMVFAELNDEVSRLLKKLAALKVESEFTLTQHVQDANAKIDRFSKEFNQLSARLNNREKEFAQQYLRLKTENEDEIKRISEAIGTQKVQHTADLKRFSEEKNQLHSDFASQMKQFRIEEEKLNKKIASLNQQLGTIMGQGGAMEQKIQQLSNEIEAKNKADVDKNNAMDRLRDEIEELNKKVITKSNEHANTERQKNQLSKEKDTLRKEYEDTAARFKKQSDEFAKERINLAASYAKMKAAQDKNTDEIEQLSSALKKTKSDYDIQAKAHNAKVGEYEGKIEQLGRLHAKAIEEMKRNHEAAIGELKNMTIRADSFSIELSQMKDSDSKLKQEHNKTIINLAQLKEEHSNVCRELAQQKTLSEKLDRTMKDLNEQKNQFSLKSFELTNVTRELAIKKQQLMELNDEVKRYRAELEKSEKQLKLQEYQVYVKQCQIEAMQKQSNNSRLAYVKNNYLYFYYLESLSWSAAIALSKVIKCDAFSSFTFAQEIVYVCGSKNNADGGEIIARNRN